MVTNVKIGEEKMKKNKLILLTAMFVAALFLTACDDGTDETEVATDPTEIVIEPTEETTESDVEPTEEVPDEPEETEEEVEDDSDFTGFYNYLDLNLGISIDEAVGLLGNPTSETTMDLLGTDTTTMVWMEINLSGSSSTTITFSDGYATSIMESIANRSRDVTSDDFAELSSGMTESEVYELIGAPYSVMVMDLLGTESTTVSWINDDFSIITISFTNGVVSSLSQVGLD